MKLILRCKDKFGQILLKFAPYGPPNREYLSIFCPPQYQDPQGGPRGQIMEGLCRLKKPYPRVPQQNSSFLDTWFSKK